MKKFLVLIIGLFLIQFSLGAIELHVGTNQTYTTITDALVNAQSYDIIVIHEGLYLENIDLDIFSGSKLTFQSSRPNDWNCIENTILNSQNPSGVVFERSFSANQQSITIEIKGLTISNSGIGIRLSDTLAPYYLLLENCIIEDNYSGINTMNFTPVVVDNCIIRNNQGTGYYFSYNAANYRVPTSIKNSQIYNNGAYGIYDDISVEIENCTIFGNYYGVHCRDAEIKNTIIQNNVNSIEVRQNGTLTVLYSNIEDSSTGISLGQNAILNWNEGNFDEDPLFNDPLNNDFSLQWDSTGRSPCIDTGDPSILNTDGTPSDMGAIPTIAHKCDEWSFESSIFNWISFPVTDHIFTTDNVIMHKFAPFVENDYLDYIAWVEALSTSNLKMFKKNDSGLWINSEHILNSPQGYIVVPTEDFKILFPGQLQDPNTIIGLAGNEVQNWIGYFLEDSRMPDVAFAGIWDNVTSIRTQYWTAQKNDGVWYGLDYPINYGDMVIVTVVNACQFSWAIEIPGSVAIERSLSEHFVYEEEMMSIPVYVDIGIDYEEISEIGIFVDDECQGAAKVDNQIVEINTYVMEDSLSGNEIVEFELFYNNRADKKRVTKYAVKEVNEDRFVCKQLSIKSNFSVKDDFYFVTFDTSKGVEAPSFPFSLSQNYPNPFNPTTNIYFSLPKEQMIKLSIYNVKGQTILSLINGPIDAGYHSVEWSGKDNYGNQVSSGVYFYRLETKDKQISRKMLLLK